MERLTEHPCKLELALLEGHQRCPACGWLAGSHRAWSGYADKGRDKTWEEYWAEEEPVELTPEEAEALDTDSTEPVAVAAPPETPEGDLKPRGQKPQIWLAVRHEVLDLVMRHRMWIGADGTMSVREAMDCHRHHNDMKGEDSTLQLAVAIMVALERAHGVGPFEALCMAIRVFEYGAEKYAPGNFRKAYTDMESMRREYTSAMERHALWRHVDPTDPESGHAHLAHAFCGALMLLEGEMYHRE